MKEMYKKYYLAMLKAVERMNESAEEKDLLRNHTKLTFVLTEIEIILNLTKLL